MVRQGDVWLARLDPTVGSEIEKTRPCVVVSPDDLNDRLQTIVAVPMTTGSRLTRFRVAAPFRGRQGVILPDQIRTLDRRRLIKCLGRIEETVLQDLLGIVRQMFDG